MQMEENGVLKLADTSWTSGWTALTPFSIAGAEHLLLYKAGSGQVKVLELNATGTAVSTIWTGNWTKGWA
jgi:hypothetical protein